MSDWAPWLRAAVCVVSVFCASVSSAQEKEVYLVTYGSGEEVWEWFGHNALWLRDDAQDLDHTFSFGYFDVDEAGFYWRFAKGQMRYFGSATLAEREFEFYRRADRSIRVQRLNLTESQFDELHASLISAIYPYPRYYDYDYYLANCSTWLRDLLDEALGGRLKQQFQQTMAEYSFREHTARKTEHHPLAKWGLMTILGSDADQAVSRWDEAFLPEVLAQQVSEVVLDGQALVLTDQMLYEPSRAVDTRVTAWLNVTLGGVGLLLGLLVVLPTLLGHSWGDWPQHLSAVFLGACGVVVFGLWFFSAHHIASPNYLAILLNPLWFGLLPIWPAVTRRVIWHVVLSVIAVGLLSWLGGLGPAQSPMMLLFFLPIAIGTLMVHRRTLWGEK